MFGLTLLIPANSIYTFSPSDHKSLNYDISKEKLDLLDPKSIFDRAQFKLIDDRAPLWYSVYQSSVLSGQFAIPLVQRDYTFFSTLGTEYDSGLAAHNIFLELIRNYGIATGIILSLAYVFMIFKASLILSLENLNLYFLIIVSSVIACGFFGGMTGQYALLGNFSFLFVGLAGLSYGFYKKTKIS
jgi:hypothetical protein